MKYKNLNSKEKLDVLKKRFKFTHLTTLELDGDRIKRNFIKPKEVTNVLYAIAIDNELMYIGKTNCFWKRMDTYRNSKYWKNANTSNVEKTEKLEQAIKAGKKVDIFVRQCVVLTINTEVGNVIVTTMHTEEPRFIKQFKPSWNVQFGKL